MTLLYPELGTDSFAEDLRGTGGDDYRTGGLGNGNQISMLQSLVMSQYSGVHSRAETLEPKFSPYQERAFSWWGEGESWLLTVASVLTG